MKHFSPLPNSKSQVIHDYQNPEQYYAISDAEWDRAMEAHLKLGHPESHDDRYFPALSDDFTVRVRPYLPNPGRREYFEQDKSVDFPANRIVPDIVKLTE